MNHPTIQVTMSFDNLWHLKNKAILNYFILNQIVENLLFYVDGPNVCRFRTGANHYSVGMCNRRWEFTNSLFMITNILVSCLRSCLKLPKLKGNFALNQRINNIKNWDPLFSSILWGAQPWFFWCSSTSSSGLLFF